jgi:hypothetical protein
MPKSIARTWLEITDVKVERVQDITEGDAISEGVLTLDPLWITKYFPGYYKAFTDWVNDGKVGKPPLGYLPTVKFKTLWQSINGPESWNTNPWVWVISFKVLSTTGKPGDI